MTIIASNWTEEERPTAAIKGRRVPFEETKDPRASQMLRFWRDAGGGRLPPKSAFLPEEFPGIVGHLSLLSVEDDETRYYYRIFSEHVQWLLNVDRPVRSVDDIEPEPYRSLVRWQFDDAVVTEAPVLHEIEYRTARYRVSYKRLSLPFGDVSGKVTHLLTLPLDNERMELADRQMEA